MPASAVNNRWRAIMVKLDAQSCASQRLTANLDSSERCANPFRDRGSMCFKQGKKFCCDRCRMDGYVLRRARAAESRVDAYGVMVAIGHLRSHAADAGHEGGKQSQYNKNEYILCYSKRYFSATESLRL
jgi:hypothetical protein